jgi:hypothetical protein
LALRTHVEQIDEEIVGQSFEPLGEATVQ